LDWEIALRRLGDAIGTLLIPEARRDAIARDGSDCARGIALHMRSDGALFTCHRMVGKPISWGQNQGFEAAIRKMADFAKPAVNLATCCSCPWVRLCAGGCRSENFHLTNDCEVPLCGPWRVQTIAEKLAEGRSDVVHWSTAHLMAEAARLNLEVPQTLHAESGEIRVPERRRLPLVRSTVVVAQTLLAACNTGSGPAKAQPSPSTVSSSATLTTQC